MIKLRWPRFMDWFVAEVRLGWWGSSWWRSLRPRWWARMVATCWTRGVWFLLCWVGRAVECCSRGSLGPGRPGWPVIILRVEIKQPTKTVGGLGCIGYGMLRVQISLVHHPIPGHTAGPDHPPVAEVHGLGPGEDAGQAQPAIILDTRVPTVVWDNLCIPRPGELYEGVAAPRLHLVFRGSLQQLC